MPLTDCLYHDAEIYILTGASRMARYRGNSKIDLEDSITSLSEGDVVIDRVNGGITAEIISEDTEDLAYVVLRPLTVTAEELYEGILEDTEQYYDDLGLLMDLVFGEED